MQEFNLNRFHRAQRRDYPTALEEITAGRKISHWMWYVFPQLNGLGFSPKSIYYGISGLEEARAYLADDYLGGNLVNICEALLCVEGKSAEEIFGYPDCMKLHSCMTLFSTASENGTREKEIFTEVLRRYFDGAEDPATVRLISQGTDL